jgi:hypothetical protein
MVLSGCFFLTLGTSIVLNSTPDRQWFGIIFGVIVVVIGIVLVLGEGLRVRDVAYLSPDAILTQVAFRYGRIPYDSIAGVQQHRLPFFRSKYYALHHPDRAMLPNSNRKFVALRLHPYRQPAGYFESVNEVWLGVRDPDAFITALRAQQQYWQSRRSYLVS